MAFSGRYLLTVATVWGWSLVLAQYYSINLGTADETLLAQPVPSPPSGGLTQEVRPKITPLDAMIDKTNHLGFRILYFHSKGNKNNIAFSPCALSSILVALYEGADGKSAAEIHETLVFPYDKDILRVGYRDIHRRLRSYFYRKENLLSGLSLSSENITIRPEYESVLKFYGYDLENIPEMKMQTTTPVPTSAGSTSSEMFTSDYEITSSSEEDKVTTEPTTTTIDLYMGSAGEEEQEEEEEEAQETTTEADLSTGVDVTESTSAATEEETATETEGVTSDEAVTEATTEEPTEATPAEESAEGGEKRRRNLRKRGQKSKPTTTTQRQQLQRKRILRSKRSPEEIDLISHQRFLQNFLLQDVTTSSPFAAFPAFSERTSQFQQDRLLDDTIEHNFYLSETETVKVPYKIYNTILKYAYIDRLQSTVLELELDSEDYKLIIILPDYEFGLNNLMKLLQIGENVPNLRDIVRQISPSWVKTIVPKFNLKGNIILTSDLQNMGINDIFEPTRADFTPMTEDTLIYAKHIEQSININIRTQSLQQLKRFTSLYKNPIELAINYPFLFCIMDKEMDLALITGRILNPLNSRIH
ncbi:uncharacterized protein LOC129729870 [Wyeomyia smithii]|uniref:uncharacterized protein LOC129729870 n=1 Tax=Wyeomyia smithii TaxID=174621 RepID=UPI00246807C0|nr:uncharacterized protein LOC129729870 [Wyeomyia smithii]XP_055544710.1 uncharacterized protein LOC129729870 [Wyeomyia smithii]